MSNGVLLRFCLLIANVTPDTVKKAWSSPPGTVAPRPHLTTRPPSSATEDPAHDLMLGYQGHAGMYWLLCHYFSQNLNLKPEVETLKSRFLIAAKVGEGQVKRWARVGRGLGEGWARGG